MTVYTSRKYTNESNKYQVVCDNSIVVFEGSQAEAQDYLDNNVLTITYADATVVAPGETITGDYVSPEQYPNRKAEAKTGSAFSAFFDPADLD
jgi:hypothetical protein